MFWSWYVTWFNLRRWSKFPTVSGADILAFVILSRSFWTKAGDLIAVTSIMVRALCASVILWGFERREVWRVDVLGICCGSCMREYQEAWLSCLN